MTILETINKNKEGFRYPLPDILLKGKAYYSLDSLKKQQVVLLKAVKKKFEEIIIQAVKETTKEHKSSNVYIDMVGEIALEDLSQEIDNTLSKLK